MAAKKPLVLTVGGIQELQSGDILDAGIRQYGVSATDPSSPTPQAGDQYYNSVLNQLMAYDGSRSKWLSVATLWDGGGVSGSTVAGAFHRRFNGMQFTSINGPLLPKCTIVGITMNNGTAATYTLGVTIDGTLVASLASGGAAAASDLSVNVDVAAGGVFGLRNEAGSDTVSAFQATVYYKLRI